MSIRITEAGIVGGEGTDTAVIRFVIEEGIAGGPDLGDVVEWTVIRTDGPGASAQESGEFQLYQPTEIEVELGPLDPGTHEITIFAGLASPTNDGSDQVTLTFEGEENGNGGGPGTPPEPDPDGLYVDSVATSRTEVPADGFVTLSTVVTNSDTTQARTGTLEVSDRDNDLLASDDVSIAPGASELFEIALQLSKTGSRRICVSVVEG